MSKNKILFNYSRLLIGFGLFVFVLSVYISALATSIYPGDNPDTITAAVTLGIPHPPGYPLYTLIGHLFTKIPLMSLAWRVNFMSAVFSALTVMVIYFILLKITKKILPALFGSLMLAFAYRYFQESLYADYLSLSNLLMSSQILILLFWRETKKEKYLYLFTLFFGLSVSHHQVVILLLPAYLYFIYVTDKNIYNNWQVVLKGSLFFLIGLLPFLYLYLRGLSHPIYSWQDTSTLSGVWNIITRKDYSGNDFRYIGYFYFRIWDFVKNLGW